METFIILITFVPFLLIPVVIYFTFQSHAKRLRVLEQVAKDLGLTFSVIKKIPNLSDSNYPEFQKLSETDRKALNLLSSLFYNWVMEGDLPGGKVVIFNETRGSGKNSRTYTIIEFFPDSKLDFDLTISRQGIFESIGIKLFGMKDIIVGQEQFDSKFRILGQDENKVKSYLKDSQIQKALLELFEEDDYIVYGNKIHYEVEKIITEFATFRVQLDRLKTLAPKIYKAQFGGTVF